MNAGEEGLFELPEPESRPTSALGAVVPAPEAPVARVLLESPLPQLDRPFDYLVPESLHLDARPGVKVKVRFGGRRMLGWLLERVAEAEPGVTPVPLSAVVSDVRALTPQVVRLCQDVAARYAGTTADVVRAAVVPRIAKVEKEGRGVPCPGPGAPAAAGWADDDGGEDFLARLVAGENPRVAASFLPDAGTGWAARLAAAAVATATSGRASILVVPDSRDLVRLCSALEGVVGSRGYVRLSAEDGPTPRYRSFLRALRGEANIIVGTRNAAFAPVADLGLVAMWDDHDASHQEPRAPYHHAREVLLLRASQTGCAALFASPARSAEVERLVLTGWAQEIAAPRRTLRSRAPWVRAVADDPSAQRDPDHSARVPHLAWAVAKHALRSGPVLVQVARRGFVPSLRCETCRTPARCRECGGPLSLPGRQRDPVCRWCGRFERHFTCPECSGHRLRAGSVGADRTLEELGRSFPGVPVVRSTGDDAVTEVSEQPALVVATPGVEPVAAGGYQAGLLLDADAQLAAEGLRVGEDTLHRWFAAARLVKARDDEGVVVLTGHPSVQSRALVRWDPAGQARRELAERGEVGLPPAVRCAVLTGQAAAVAAFVEDITSAVNLRAIGPTPTEEEGEHRWILFFGHTEGPQVTALLRRRKVLSAMRREPLIRVRVDDSSDL